MAFTPGDPDSLSGFIDDNWKKYNFKENPQQFLPRKALDEATTIPIIEEFVRRGDLGLSPSEAVSFAHRVNSGAPKLFILCIYCDLGMKFLKGLIDKQLTDDNLPLSANDCPIPKQQRHFNSAFLTNQKCFKVATFNMNSDQALNNTCTIPIEHTDNRKSLLGKGAFGEVYKIKIDKDYYSFVCFS
jgi:hypothetical protein